MADLSPLDAPTDSTPDKARKRGGREARRSERAAGAQNQPHCAYIVRGIPTYDVLSEENLQKIERVADRILAEVGIESTLAG